MRESRSETYLASHDGEEGAEVTDAEGLGVCEDKKTNGAEDCRSGDEGRATASLVRVVGDHGGVDGGRGVGRGGEEEGSLGVISAAGKDDGQEEGEGVRAGGGEAEAETEEPDLEVGKVLEDLGSSGTVRKSVSTVGVDAVDGVLALGVGEELGAVGEVDDDEPRDDTETDGDGAEDDEHPAPSEVAVLAAKLADTLQTKSESVPRDLRNFG